MCECVRHWRPGLPPCGYCAASYHSTAELYRRWEQEVWALAASPFATSRRVYIALILLAVMSGYVRMQGQGTLPVCFGCALIEGLPAQGSLFG
jgi:hypothetical protein